MYESFYGLTQKPFETTPDPRYFFPSAKHEEALANLCYAVQQRRGFALITGEIGTGKTMISHMLLGELGDRALVAIITNTHLSAKGLLQTISYELDLPYAGLTKEELMLGLNEFLANTLAEDRNVVLVIDEAQNLTPTVLEEVRMLSNSEAESEKLMQIVLIGQPLLRHKLAMCQLAQLRQRISVSFHLYPLNREDTYGYIRHRLHVAGAEQEGLFTESALAKMFEFTRGIPRTINILCDHAMLLGYIKESSRIHGLIVDEAIYDLERGMQTSDSSAPKMGAAQIAEGLPLAHAEAQPEPEAEDAGLAGSEAACDAAADDLETPEGTPVCAEEPDQAPSDEQAEADHDEDSSEEPSRVGPDERGGEVLTGPAAQSRLPVQKVDDSVRQALLHGSQDQMIQAALNEDQEIVDRRGPRARGEDVVAELVKQPADLADVSAQEPEDDEMDGLHRALEQTEAAAAGSTGDTQPNGGPKADVSVVVASDPGAGQTNTGGQQAETFSTLFATLRRKGETPVR